MTQIASSSRTGGGCAASCVVGAASFAVAMVGCESLLGVDFEGRSRGPTADAANFDTAAPDAGETELQRLARRRVRIAEAQGHIASFASSNWLYWVDNARIGHGLRPSDRATRPLYPEIQAANDFNVVVLNRLLDNATIYDASSVAAAGSFRYGTATPAALQSTLLFFYGSLQDTTKVLSWSTAGQTELSFEGFVPSGSVELVGKSDTTAYMRDLTNSKVLFALNVAPFSLRQVPIVVRPERVLQHPDGDLIVHRVGPAVRLLLLRTVGAITDLTALIEVAASAISSDLRAPLFSSAVAQLDAWTIFSAKAGILAYRASDQKLVALQLRRAEDAFNFDGLHVAAGPKILMFTIGTGPDAGLYYSPIADLLPE
jgi:hypothetical protein